MNKQRKNDLLALGACVLIYAIFEVLIQLEIIGPFWELNMVLICINIILASSLNMINGYTGQFSIGHAGFLAVGAYVGAIFTVKLGLPFPVAIIAGTIAAGFLGFLIGLPTLRLNGDYLAIATLGLRRNYSYLYPEHRLCRRRFRFHGHSPSDQLHQHFLDHDRHPVLH
jgi:branched-chain amino acid transport system permease protein